MFTTLKNKRNGKWEIVFVTNDDSVIHSNYYAIELDIVTRWVGYLEYGVNPPSSNLIKADLDHIKKVITREICV